MNRKSTKMESGELMDMIKACVKEAMEEQVESKEGEETVTEEAASPDVSSLIEQAMELVEEKRKS